MGSVFIEPGGEVPTSLADVHFATLTRNSVDTRPALGGLAGPCVKSVGLASSGGCMEHSNSMLVKDALDVVRSVA